MVLPCQGRLSSLSSSTSSSSLSDRFKNSPDGGLPDPVLPWRTGTGLTRKATCPVLFTIGTCCHWFVWHHRRHFHHHSHFNCHHYYRPHLQQHQMEGSCISTCFSRTLLLNYHHHRHLHHYRHRRRGRRYYYSSPLSSANEGRSVSLCFNLRPPLHLRHHRRLQHHHRHHHCLRPLPEHRPPIKALLACRTWTSFSSCLQVYGIFSGSSHTSDLQIGTPVATLPGAWRYRVSAGTGRPGVSIL